MNKKPGKFLNNVVCCGLVAGGSVTALQLFAAQTVLTGYTPPISAPIAQTEDLAKDDMAVFVPTGQQRNVDDGQPLKFGGMIFRPHASYQFIYSDGMQATPGAEERTIIQTLAPGISVDFGSHWTLDYTPSLRFYSNDAFRDSVDHSASLAGRFRYEDWVFGFSQSFSQTDSTLVETATQTKQESYVTMLTAACQLSEKFSTEMAVQQSFNFVETQQDSRSWVVSDWLNYQAAKRLFFGVGGSVGYVNLASTTSPDQVFESVQGRIQWRPTEKLSFSLNGGVECRQILDEAYSDPVNPIFGASVQYAPFDHTQITLSGSRTVGSSDYYFIAQSTETTTVGLVLNQRLLEKFQFTGGVNWTQSEYSVALGSYSNVRTDETYSFNARLGRDFLKRGNVAVTYQYTDNQSTISGFSFRGSQIGLELSFAY